MALIDIASSKSIWRGIEYYNQNKVAGWTDNGDGTYEGVVKGSNNTKYSVHVDTIHPRKSTCNCPLANGKQIICKHILAVSFCINPNEIERFTKEKTYFTSEKEERYAKKYDKYMAYAKTMSPKELREAFVELRIELDEIYLNEKYEKR